MSDNDQDDPGGLLTLLEAQQVLRCGRTKIYELCGAGKLEIVKLGPRSSRVTQKSVRRFLQQLSTARGQP